MTEPIKATPTARSDVDLRDMKNILTDALYEMGYDNTLTDTLIERNVIDFGTVDSTRDIIVDLVEYYGEEILSGHLQEVLGIENTTNLRYDREQSWRTFKDLGFENLLQHIITESIESLGLRMVDSCQLRRRDLTPELSKVKRNLVIDCGEFGLHLPDVDIVIYNPKNQRVIAVVSSQVTLRERIAQTGYWKLKLLESENTRHIKVYFVTIDEDKTLTSVHISKRGRAIAEIDLDGTYVLTAEELEESNKVKLFEHFIEDLKQIIEESQ